MAVFYLFAVSFKWGYTYIKNEEFIIVFYLVTTQITKFNPVGSPIKILRIGYFGDVTQFFKQTLLCKIKRTIFSKYFYSLETT